MEGVAPLVDLIGPLAFFVAGIGASESESEAIEDELRFKDGLGAVEPKPTLVGAISAYALLAEGIMGRRHLRLIVKPHLPSLSMKICCRQSMSLVILGSLNIDVGDEKLVTKVRDRDRDFCAPDRALASQIT